MRNATTGTGVPRNVHQLFLRSSGDGLCAPETTLSSQTHRTRRDLHACLGSPGAEPPRPRPRDRPPFALVARCALLLRAMVPDSRACRRRASSEAVRAGGPTVSNGRPGPGGVPALGVLRGNPARESRRRRIGDGASDRGELRRHSEASASHTGSLGLRSSRGRTHQIRGG